MSELVKTKHYENRQQGYTHRYVIEFYREDRFFTIYCTACPPDPHGKSVSHHHKYESGKLCQREGYLSLHDDVRECIGRSRQTADGELAKVIPLFRRSQRG